MAEFADEYLKRPRPSDQSYIEIGMLKDLNPSITENFFSLDSFLAHHQPQYPPIYAHNTINNLSTFNPGEIILNSPPIFPDNKKRKLELPSASCSKNISPAASNITSTKRNNNIGRGKKGKSKEKQVEKADQVIHVRAKRGQATDSHSIAERVRREKINNKLRCLQDLVPGCHKSMGMAVMLEEIINYVHSLQNQVEFLSMELAAASCSYDLNLETESSKKAQVINSLGTQEMQKWLRDRYGELNCYQSTWSI